MDTQQLISFLHQPGAPLTFLGWVLMVGVPTVWLAGQLGIVNSARRIGLFTPMLTAFVGGLILFQMQAWPFSQF